MNAHFMIGFDSTRLAFIKQHNCWILQYNVLQEGSKAGKAASYVVIWGNVSFNSATWVCNCSLKMTNIFPTWFPILQFYSVFSAWLEIVLWAGGDVLVDITPESI